MRTRFSLGTDFPSAFFVFAFRQGHWVEIYDATGRNSSLGLANHLSCFINKPHEVTRSHAFRLFSPNSIYTRAGEVYAGGHENHTDSFVGLGDVLHFQ
jgi:hypothetical protein